MTETTTQNNETGPCVGCRLPWNEEIADGCCRKTAALVLTEDSGIKVTAFFVPSSRETDEQAPAEPEIIIGVRV